MKLNDLSWVSVYSYDGKRWDGMIAGIVGREGMMYYRVISRDTTKTALFLVKPELHTCRHYNLGNRAFWIEYPTECKFNFLEK